MNIAPLQSSVGQERQNERQRTAKENRESVCDWTAAAAEAGSAAPSLFFSADPIEFRPVASDRDYISHYDKLQQIVKKLYI